MCKDGSQEQDFSFHLKATTGRAKKNADSNDWQSRTTEHVMGLLTARHMQQPNPDRCQCRRVTAQHICMSECHSPFICLNLLGALETSLFVGLSQLNRLGGHFRKTFMNHVYGKRIHMFFQGGRSETRL